MVAGDRARAGATHARHTAARRRGAATPVVAHLSHGVHRRVDATMTVRCNGVAGWKKPVTPPPTADVPSPQWEHTCHRVHHMVDTPATVKCNTMSVWRMPVTPPPAAAISRPPVAANLRGRAAG